MKKIIFVLFLAGLIFCARQNVSEAITFYPSDWDMGDLDHGRYYTWGINWNIPTGEVITEATLTFRNIWDWVREDGDHLYTHLLDNPASGLTSGSDTNSVDEFSGQGTLVGDWSDPYGGYPRGYNLVYTFSELGLLDELSAYAMTPSGTGKANFGFGIDPDCHYYNRWIKFEITTAPIPEPASLSLLGLGLLGLAGFRKKRKV